MRRLHVGMISEPLELFLRVYAKFFEIIIRAIDIDDKSDSAETTSRDALVLFYLVAVDVDDALRQSHLKVRLEMISNLCPVPATMYHI